MLRDVSVVLDPPPNGVFTFEDTVIGRVLFESHRDEKLDCCQVYFHCWVGTHVVKSTGNYQTNQVNSANYKDKDVIFGTSKKVYIGRGETLQKRVQYEWPFRFDFRSEVDDAAALPSSGNYGNGNIEYKVIAMPLTPAQAANTEHTVNAFMNPNDQLFQKEAPINLSGLFLSAAKHLGGAAEQEIQFVQIRPHNSVDGSLIAFQSSQEIAASHVPQLPPSIEAVREKHGFLSKSPHIPFEVDLQIPRGIIEDSYFPMLLKVTSPVRGWIENPPPATIVALKIHLISLTVERASQQQQVHDRSLLLVDAKGLKIPLGEGGVDMGQIFPIRVTGAGIVPSFDTRLMSRKYLLQIEARIEVARKEFHVKFPDVKDFEVVSQHVAVGRAAPPPDAMPAAPKEKPVYQLKHSYIGRISQDSTGVIKEASVMEAALAVSRALTKYEVPHEFPGGSLVKILPYRYDRNRTNSSNFDQVTDSEKIKACFAQECSLRTIEPLGWSPEERLQVKLSYNDVIYRENLTVLFPSKFLTTLGHHGLFAYSRIATLIWNDDLQKKWGKETRNPADAVKLDAVSLFNYRLSCAITHGNLNESQLGDFEGLYLSFSKDLHHHRKHIDVNAAR
jgi:hypothetical protein